MRAEIALLLLIGSVSLVLARPQKGGDESQAEIVNLESNIEPDGSYNYAYETSNGINAQETGTLKKASGPDTSDVIIASGTFSYTSPEGNLITLTYKADDEGGFQPVGDHLPTPPPVPPAIQKAVDYLLSLPPAKRR